MNLVALNETGGERRVAVIPSVVAKLCQLGLTVRVECAAGAAADCPDEAYRAAGAEIFTDRAAALRSANMVWHVQHASEAEEALLQPGTLYAGFFDPFRQTDRLRRLAQAGVHVVSMEMMPRTTLAQKMDALSSQANLAGYAAVIQGAGRLGRILPMMMTPAGTLSPARAFIIGVGVAGLQAIATAKRLGARVEAFDTRPVVEEQVRSLGAKFVKIDLGQTGQSAQGYAQELTPEQVELQREGMAKICAQSDLVITTAKLFGRPAPRLVTQAMLSRMQPGSVVVDLATAAGGNVEGSRLGETVVTENGVHIIGEGALEGTVARDSSAMYAANLHAFLEHFWDAEAKAFAYRLDDEILAGCLLSYGGRIVHPRFTETQPAS